MEQTKRRGEEGWEGDDQARRDFLHGTSFALCLLRRRLTVRNLGKAMRISLISELMRMAERSPAHESALRCLPDLEVMLLNIGTNFSPDHLEEMFEEPRLGIRRMEMRFRPYVEQASYYQFLAGKSALFA